MTREEWMSPERALVQSEFGRAAATWVAKTAIRVVFAALSPRTS